MPRFLSLAFLFFGFNQVNAQIDVDWVSRHGSYTTDRCNAVCVDGEANLFTAGIFTDTLSLNGQTHIGIGFLDGYIAKLDSNGNQIWIQLALGPDDDQPTHLITLPNGDVVASGNFGDSISISNATVHALGNDDVWLARLNGEDGAVEWLISVGSVYAYENVGGLVATNDAIHWAVNFGSTINISTNTFTSQGFNDAAIIKLDHDGNIISTNVLSGSHNDNVLSLAADNDGNVYAGGRFNG
ncbi:MAG TPA: hypothetical protein VEY71_06140, partial [Chitinophagales bacterium]|nr:hypothetical protein [Chitinophagales bacterium]